MAAIARHVVGLGLDALPMPAGGADGVRQREDSSQSFDHARLAPHDRPPLRRMIANLEESPIDRHVVPIDVEHDDVARGDPNDGIPGAAPQRVRTSGTDARPTLHLKASGRDHPVADFHVFRLPTCASGRRDWSHRGHGRSRSTTLRKSADVTFRTSLDERQLRATVRTGTDEVLLRAAPSLQERFGPPGPPGPPGPQGRGGWRRDDWTGREEVLLDALLV